MEQNTFRVRVMSFISHVFNAVFGCCIPQASNANFIFFQDHTEKSEISKLTKFPPFSSSLSLIPIGSNFSNIEFKLLCRLKWLQPMFFTFNPALLVKDPPLYLMLNWVIFLDFIDPVTLSSMAKKRESI